LQERIGHLLTRPVGRPPKKPQVFFASVPYQAQSWTRPRRVVAKVEWHQGELYPRVGFPRHQPDPAGRAGQQVLQRSRHRRAVDPRGEERVMLDTAVLPLLPPQRRATPALHALAYNLANFFRSLALPREVAQWSLTTLREKLVKIGARIVHHGRYLVFQLAEVAVPRTLFATILGRIKRLRPQPPPLPA
jgi:Transposase DDE domain group 1